MWSGGLLQVVSTQMQATATLKRQLVARGLSSEHIRSDTWGVMTQVHKEDGICGFWKGEPSQQATDSGLSVRTLMSGLAGLELTGFSWTAHLCYLCLEIGVDQ